MNHKAITILSSLPASEPESRTSFSVQAGPSACDSAGRVLAGHWPEYLMEAFGLGLFMVSACGFGAVLEYPGSAVHQILPSALFRRVLMGAAMGLTNVLNIYSPWGKQSGAHLNPAVTWTFFRLGKIKKWDAIFYTAFQFTGGVLGVLVARAGIDHWLAHPSVNYVATIPGSHGIAAAFAAEVFISFILMSVVLRVSNTMSIARFTGLFASALVMTYISIEAPVSGMSMNPARTLGSALSAGTWTALWIYFTAPPLGMLLAAQLHLRLIGTVMCAKLHHQNDRRCIFCGSPSLKRATAPNSN
jgi:aquaporin Z